METKQLALTAAKGRQLALTCVYEAASGHPGGSMSAMDLMTVLYFDVMNIDPADPQAPGRDRFVLSKGHCTPALYSILALRGYFPVEELHKFRRIDAHYSGHPDMVHVKGVDMSTGSLGQGISCACGMAKGGKYLNKDFRVYTLLGDGEIQEGQVWEAMMFASHYHLDNLCVIIDNNGLQIDGAVDKVMSPYPIDEKLKAFGFHVICINGNDMADIDRAMQEAKTVKGQPTAILMKTTKGKGVSYMEGKAEWHGKAPNDEQYELGLAELRSALSELEGK